MPLAIFAAKHDENLFFLERERMMGHDSPESRPRKFIMKYVCEERAYQMKEMRKWFETAKVFDC
jgi:hypothetical protein